MTDKIDRILEAGSTPDWISPLIAIIKDAIYGPSKRLYIDRMTGFSVNEVKAALKAGRVEFWGDSIADEWIVVTVNITAVNRALAALEVAGIEAYPGK